MQFLRLKQSSQIIRHLRFRPRITHPAVRFTCERVSSTSVAKTGMSFRKKAFVGLGVVSTSGLIGGGVTYWHYLEKEKANNKKLLDDCNEHLQKINEKIENDKTGITVEVDKETKEVSYKHPYAKLPWYKKLVMMISRSLYLAYLFVPAMFIGSVGYLTNSQTIRAYFIEYIVNSIKKAGSVMQKYAQWISNKPDMFDEDVIEAFKTFTDDSPSHSFEYTKKEIKKQFGKEIEEIFEEFEEEPLASGTVGQVHKAKLKEEYAMNGKTDVIVKVRHPNVLKETFVDADILFSLISFVGKWNKRLKPPFSKKEFIDLLKKQLDFKHEVRNMLDFRKNFAIEHLTIKFPEISLDIMSSSVLVEEFVKGKNILYYFEKIKVGSGFKLADLDNIVDDLDINSEIDNLSREIKHNLAVKIMDVAMKMFLRDNLVHGDMHGGNVIYNKETEQLTIIDSGIATTIDGDETMRDFMLLLYGVVNGNYNQISDSMCRMCVDYMDYEFLTEQEKLKIDNFKKGVKDICHKWIDPETLSSKQLLTRDGDPVPLGDLMSDIFILLTDYEMKLRGDIATSLTSIAMIEGLVKQLDPELDMVSVASPHIAKLGLSEIIRLKNRRVRKDSDVQITDVSNNEHSDIIDTAQLLNDMDFYGIA